MDQLAFPAKAGGSCEDSRDAGMRLITGLPQLGPGLRRESSQCRVALRLG
jgi:hypothetical protein